MTLIVLTALFAVQKHGTGGIGKFLARSRDLVWRAGLLGVHIIENPAVLMAMSPTHAIDLIIQHPAGLHRAGCGHPRCHRVEALYADMGRFGKRPIA